MYVPVSVAMVDIGPINTLAPIPREQCYGSGSVGSIPMFLGLLDPDPDPLLGVKDPDPSIIKHK